jgi:hypothetical protein
MWCVWLVFDLLRLSLVEFKVEGNDKGETRPTRMPCGQDLIPEGLIQIDVLSPCRSLDLLRVHVRWSRALRLYQDIPRRCNPRYHHTRYRHHIGSNQSGPSPRRDECLLYPSVVSIASTSSPFGSSVLTVSTKPFLFAPIRSSLNFSIFSFISVARRMLALQVQREGCELT